MVLAKAKTGECRDIDIHVSTNDVRMKQRSEVTKCNIASACKSARKMCRHRVIVSGHLRVRESDELYSRVSNHILRQKIASGYQDSDHSPRIRQRFFLQQRQRSRHSPNTSQDRHLHYLQEEATQVQRTKSHMPGQDPEKATGKAAVTVNTTRQRGIIGQ